MTDLSLLPTVSEPVDALPQADPSASAEAASVPVRRKRTPRKRQSPAAPSSGHIKHVLDIAFDCADLPDEAADILAHTVGLNSSADRRTLARRVLLAKPGTLTVLDDWQLVTAGEDALERAALVMGLGTARVAAVKALMRRIGLTGGSAPHDQHPAKTASRLVRELDEASDDTLLAVETACEIAHRVNA